MDNQSQQTPGNVNLSNNQQPQEPPKSKGYLIVALFVLAILIVGGSIISYFFLVSSPDTIEVSKPIGIKDAEPLDNGLDISDWQTYKNEEFGFSLQYPSDWVLKESTQTSVTGTIFTLRSPKVEELLEERKIDGGYSYNLIVSFWPNMNNEYARDGSILGRDDYASLDDYFTDEENPNPSPKKVGDIIVDGLNAYEVSIGGAGLAYGVMVENNGIYRLSFLTAWDKSKLGSTEKEILSTFKFIESSDENNEIIVKDTIQRLDGIYYVKSIPRKSLRGSGSYIFIQAKPDGSDQKILLESETITKIIKIPGQQKFIFIHGNEISNVRVSIFDPLTGKIELLYNEKFPIAIVATPDGQKLFIITTDTSYSNFTLVSFIKTGEQYEQNDETSVDGAPFWHNTIIDANNKYLIYSPGYDRGGTTPQITAINFESEEVTTFRSLLTEDERRITSGAVPNQNNTKAIFVVNDSYPKDFLCGMTAYVSGKTVKLIDLTTLEIETIYDDSDPLNGFTPIAIDDDGKSVLLKKVHHSIVESSYYDTCVETNDEGFLEIDISSKTSKSIDTIDQWEMSSQQPVYQVTRGDNTSYKFETGQEYTSVTQNLLFNGKIIDNAQDIIFVGHY